MSEGAASWLQWGWRRGGGAQVRRRATTGLSEPDAARLVAHDMPDILAEARRLAAAIERGAHGRRRAGSGDAFWQYRDYQSGDDAKRIDWKRSAKGDGVILRETEHETAQPVRLILELGPPMAWRSNEALPAKARRAAVIALACGLSALKSGERVGWLGAPKSHLGAGAGDALAYDPALSATTASALPAAAPKRGEAILWVTDGLCDLDALEAWLGGMRELGAGGGALIVADPAELDFPYHGRVRFMDPGSDWSRVFGKAQSMREAYLAKRARHFERFEALCRSANLATAFHVTEKDAVEGALKAAALLEGGR